MKHPLHTLLLGTMALMPIAASANSLTTQTTSNTYAMAQNLTTPELNAIKDGRLTNNGQAIPVETQIMMSTGNLDSYTISKIQQSLTERGFYKGSITGAWDNQTSLALQSFQRTNGQKIDETGVLISSNTLASLGVPMDKLTAGDGARLSGNYSQQTTAPIATPRTSANTGASFDPYKSSTVKTLGTVQMAANSDQTVGDHVSKTQMTPPGKTVAAPDNGSKSTITRDAVATGRFNETIDGSPARGTTDANAAKSATTPNNSVAGTRATTPVNSNNATNTPVVGTTSLSAGSTSSASVQTTGSLTDTTGASANGGVRGNRLEPDNNAASNADIAPATGGSSSLGGKSSPTGTLSNSASVSATGSSSGIANTGGSLSGDGKSANTSSLSGSGSSAGSLSGSRGASGGGGAGGGGL